MVASQVTMWFIIVLTGTVLHGAGVTNINTAADAARALEPLVKTFPHAGEIAQGLFALGIVSLGMLAVPVLAGSTSYALSEAREKKEGLDLKPRQGRYFYGVITGAMLIGLCLNLLGLNPIHFLVFSAVFNGIAAVPLIWIINRIAADRRAMGAAASGWLSRTILMITFIGMAGFVVGLFLSSLSGMRSRCSGVRSQGRSWTGPTGWSWWRWPGSSSLVARPSARHARHALSLDAWPRPSSTSQANTRRQGVSPR